ncbi:MAG: hypothetical protein WC541_07520 [Dehalococcoidia bacterium]
MTSDEYEAIIGADRGEALIVFIIVLGTMAALLGIGVLAGKLP